MICVDLYNGGSLFTSLFNDVLGASTFIKFVTCFVTTLFVVRPDKDDQTVMKHSIVITAHLYEFVTRLTHNLLSITSTSVTAHARVVLFIYCAWN